MGIPIPNYERYMIETDGTIYSTITNKILKPSLGKNGYLYIELAGKNGRKRLAVHRLVAITYIENPKNLPIVNHKNEVKTDNNVDNLEWCTVAYNISYGTAQERRRAHTNYSKPCYAINARKNGRVTRKPVAMFTKEGKYICSFESGKQASIATKVSHSHLLECCSGKRKSAGGYRWSYIERGDDLSVSQSS